MIIYISSPAAGSFHIFIRKIEGKINILEVRREKIFNAMQKEIEKSKNFCFTIIYFTCTVPLASQFILLYFI